MPTLDDLPLSVTLQSDPDKSGTAVAASLTAARCMIPVELNSVHSFFKAEISEVVFAFVAPLWQRVNGRKDVHSVFSSRS